MQSLQSFFWDEASVRRNMEKTLIDNLDSVVLFQQRHNCDLRTAAYAIAIQRILEAVELRGLYP